MCLFLGAGSAFADPHPPLPAEPSMAPVEIIAKAPPAGPPTSSRQYRCAVQSAISSPSLARLPPSSPSTVDTRHWMEIPRACRFSKTLQRMMRASATSETAHGPNRAIRRMRRCRAPLTPSGHDGFAAGCACPGGTSCSRLTGSKVSVRRPASVDSATHPARRSPIGARWERAVSPFTFRPFRPSIMSGCRSSQQQQQDDAARVLRRMPLTFASPVPLRASTSPIGTAAGASGRGKLSIQRRRPKTAH